MAMDLSGNLRKIYLYKEKELYVTSNKTIKMYFECFFFIADILSNYEKTARIKKKTCYFTVSMNPEL